MSQCEFGISNAESFMENLAKDLSILDGVCIFYFIFKYLCDRLCGLVVKSSWLQIQRSGFDSRRYQIFREVVGMEQGSLTLVSTTEELLERKSSSFGLENRDYGHRASATPTSWHPSIRKSWH
jgi:hypothetical protein